MTLVWFGILIASLWMLTKGADFVLDGAQRVGGRLGLTAFAAGAIIIGALTSLPDLVAAIAAQLHGAPDIVTGVAVGANIADIFLIAAIIAIMTRGVTIVSDDISFDIAWLATATAALVLVAINGVISTRESFLLLMIFGVYVFTTYAIARERRANGKHNAYAPVTASDITKLTVGFVLLIVGANFAVDAAIYLAGVFNIAAGVIGLFAIALGTTLPEFFVTLQAVRAGKASMAIGNVFGSNVFNALVVVGLPGILGKIEIDEITYVFGLTWMVASTALFIWAVLTRRRISRAEGILYLGGYLLFALIVAGTVG